MSLHSTLSIRPLKPRRQRLILINKGLLVAAADLPYQVFQGIAEGTLVGFTMGFRHMPVHTKQHGTTMT